MGGKQGVKTAPASSILHSCLRSLFSWLPPFSIVASRTVDIKTCIFSWNTNLPPLCLNCRPQSFQKVDNAIHWTNVYQTDSAYNSVVSLIRDILRLRKTQFCCLFIYTLFWGKQGPFFLGFFLLGLFGIKTCSFPGTQFFSWNTNLSPLCLNSRPQSFKRWLTLCTG